MAVTLPKGMDPSTVTFAENWSIYHLYVRQEYDDCLAKIEEQLRLCNGLCEYAVFVKGPCESAHVFGKVAGVRRTTMDHRFTTAFFPADPPR